MSKNKLKCNVTGKMYGISKGRRDKLIQKFGSEEALISNFVSREGKKQVAPVSDEPAVTTGKAV